MFLDLLLITPCRIESMAQNIYTAIPLEKNKIFFFNFRIIAGSPKKFGYKNLTQLSRNCNFVRWGILI